MKFWETPVFRDTDINEQLIPKLHELESVHHSPVLFSEAGEPVAVDITASLYSEGNRQVIQFNIRDVSARKRIEEQLARNQEEFQEAQKLEAVGRLAGGVAHDFNNLLTAIAGFSDLLRDHLAGDEEGRKLVDHIREGTDRAIAVTKQLLAFGRRQILSPTIVDVNAVVQELQQVAAVMMTREVELQVDLDPKLGKVKADKTQLEQVILNLIMNARDAMPDGGSLKVQTANLDADQEFTGRNPTVPVGNYVTITVQDTGTGMDEQTKARMFEPFFSTKPKGIGVGLGLPTVYSIVKGAGGYISATSRLGVGTNFTVYLPRVEPEAEPQTAKPAEAADGNETVLLVEDEHAVRELTRRFLEMRGYRVLEAANGREALRISRTHNGPIHIMVTDVVMPKMSGREVALQLASERPDMKVLYVSGHTEESIVDHGVLKEGVEFLQKPFSQQELVGRVRRILDGK